MAMCPKKRKGFTLIELLVVVAIIALLVAILLPSLSRAKELAKRANCSSNLHSVGQGVHLYAQDYRDVLPSFRDTDMTATAVGFQYDVETPGGSTQGNTRGWFMLVKDGYVGLGMFKCPSDREVDRDSYQTDRIYDFRPAQDLSPISYALQVTKQVTGNERLTSVDDNANLAIAADINGLFTPAIRIPTVCGYQRDNNINLDDTRPSTMNSPSHARQGQNVLRLLGSVGWETDPLCGVNKDNIWTIKTADDDQMGADATSGNLYVDTDGKLRDSWLMP